MKVFCLIVVLFIIPRVQGQQAGSVAGNVIVLDANEVSEMHEGFAVVRKGDDFAIINSEGKYLIPYGQYLINENTTASLRNTPFNFAFTHGFCKVRDKLSGKFGLIDTSGKLFLPCIYYDIEPFTDDGYSLLADNSQGKMDYYYMDKKKNKIPVKSDYPRYYCNGLAKTREGYIDRKGNVKMAVNKYRAYNDFSEGLAAVSIVNDYNNELWGYIDTTGKTVIPFQFAKEPGPFSNGLAKTTPQNSDQYYYAFIDKAGKLKFTINKPQEVPYGYGGNGNFIKRSEAFYSPSSHQFVYMNASRGGDFYKGLAFWEQTYFYDTSGNFTDLRKIVPADIAAWEGDLNILSFDGNILKVTVRNHGHCNSYAYGLISKAGAIVLPVEFCELQDFDTKSGLAYAEFRTSANPPTMSSDFRKGFINKDGVFVMVLPQ